MGGVSAAVSKTAAAPIERVKLLIQNQVSRTFNEDPHNVEESTIDVQTCIPRSKAVFGICLVKLFIP